MSTLVAFAGGCTFFDCTSQLPSSIVTAAQSGTMIVEVDYVADGHSHGCECDTAQWTVGQTSCSALGTIVDRTPMGGAARITLTPRVPSQPLPPLRPPPPPSMPPCLSMSCPTPPITVVIFSTTGSQGGHLEAHSSTSEVTLGESNPQPPIPAPEPQPQTLHPGHPQPLAPNLHLS